jgi:protein TonB
MHSPPEYAIATGESIEVTLLDGPTEEPEGAPETELLAVPEPEIAAPPEETPPPPEAPPEPPEPEPEPIIEPEPKPEPVMPVAEPPARPKPKPAAASKPAPAPNKRPPAGISGAAVTGRPAKAGAGSGQSGARVLARPNYLRNPPPKYTARVTFGPRGSVVLLLVAVTPDGRPGDVRMKRSSGFFASRRGGPQRRPDGGASIQEVWGVSRSRRKSKCQSASIFA